MSLSCMEHNKTKNTLQTNILLFSKTINKDRNVTHPLILKIRGSIIYYRDVRMCFEIMEKIYLHACLINPLELNYEMIKVADIKKHKKKYCQKKCMRRSGEYGPMRIVCLLVAPYRDQWRQ